METTTFNQLDFARVTRELREALIQDDYIAAVRVLINAPIPPLREVDYFFLPIFMKTAMTTQEGARTHIEVKSQRLGVKFSNPALKSAVEWAAKSFDALGFSAADVYASFDEWLRTDLRQAALGGQNQRETVIYELILAGYEEMEFIDIIKARSSLRRRASKERTSPRNAAAHALAHLWERPDKSLLFLNRHGVLQVDERGLRDVLRAEKETLRIRSDADKIAPEGSLEDSVDELVEYVEELERLHDLIWEAYRAAEQQNKPAELAALDRLTRLPQPSRLEVARERNVTVDMVRYAEEAVIQRLRVGMTG